MHANHTPVFWTEVCTALAQAQDLECTVQRVQPLGGGCINEAAVLHTQQGQRFFVKLNQAARLGMFEAEALGLEALAAAQAIRVPKPLCWGIASPQRAFLVLEYIELSGRLDAVRFAEQLAQLHRHSAAAFGWVRDNTLGSTPQPNPWQADWIAFFRTQRLGHQWALAQKRGADTAMLAAVEALQARLEAFFVGYAPEPSLLHGDLWSGNWGADAHHQPVIYDPAVYFGDREADLAMMELFGSPGSAFFRAYDAVWPIDPGYALRRDLYNLYHLLNHFNLFGGGYAQQTLLQARRLLASL